RIVLPSKAVPLERLHDIHEMAALLKLGRPEDVAVGYNSVSHEEPGALKFLLSSVSFYESISVKDILDIVHRVMRKSTGRYVCSEVDVLADKAIKQVLSELAEVHDNVPNIRKARRMRLVINQNRI